MSKKVILLTLQSFSTTGGIQKMARTLSHALHKLCTQNNWQFKVLSLYDTVNDLNTDYLPEENFKGFGKNRLQFLINILKDVKRNDTVILSHINLASVGILIKLLKPTCKVWLIAHGIEVWRPLSFHKKQILKFCSKIICVSRFTQEQMIKRHQVNGEVCRVLNNAIDPFIKLPSNFVKPGNLLERYSLAESTPVILTLTRLASTEMYKGYDRVIAAVSQLKNEFPYLKYILAGQHDTLEGQRVKQLIIDHDVSSQVILTGFIDENELADHFLLADLFVLPSKKEGFGIVFIEALACGLPVICGNADGSVDAIKDGELGKAINPDDISELKQAIAGCLKTPLTLHTRKKLQEKSLAYFNEDEYIKNLQKILDEEIAG